MATRSIELDSDVTVHVTSEHPHYPGRWIGHCPALAMQDVDLGAEGDMDIDAAAIGALLRAHRRADVVRRALVNRICQDTTKVETAS